MPRANILAQEALDLCENLGEALVILPTDMDDSDNEWISWEQNLQLWMELQPEATENYQKYIRHLREVGRINKARHVAEKNYALNPLSVRSIGNLSLVYQYEGRYDEAITLADEARALGSTMPDFAQQGQQVENCNSEVECVLDLLPPPLMQFRDRLRQVFTKPTTPAGQETAIQVAVDLLEETPWSVNFFNALPCEYEHLTPLFYKTWEISKATGAFWYWPNLWLKSCGNVWGSENFPAFAEEADLVEYWRVKGWADACRPEGESFVCNQMIYDKSMSGRN